MGLFPSSTTYTAGFSVGLPSFRKPLATLPTTPLAIAPRQVVEETFTYDAQNTNNALASSTEALLPTASEKTVAVPNPPEGTTGKKKKKPPAEIPVELLMLALSGYLSTLNPALASVITEQIDTSFFWNFNILDYAGMGFPRVSRSLKRGAIPYNPDTDPETQEREGLEQWVYIKQQQAKNANWDNLWEEFLRECQNSPGALLLPALLFTAIPLTSRFTGFPAGRRAFQIGGKEIDNKHVQPLVSYLENQTDAKTPFPSDVAGRKTLLSEYYQSLFIQEKPEFLTATLPPVSVPINKPVTLFPLFQGFKERPSESNYTLTPQQLEALAGKKLPALNTGGIDLTVGNIPFQIERHPSPDFAKANAFVLSTKENVTVGQLSKAWADALANLTAFQLEHNGVAKATFPWGANAALHTKHHRLIQEYVLLTNMLDVGIELANKQLGASSSKNPSQLILGGILKLKDESGKLKLKDEKGFKVGSFIQFANQTDKVQDVIVAAFQKLDKAKATVTPSVDNFVHALKQTQNTMGALKFVVTIGSAIWMSWWMWTLAHILQAGRAYPANRLVRSEGVKNPLTTPTIVGNNNNKGKTSSTPLVEAPKLEGTAS